MCCRSAVEDEVRRCAVSHAFRVHGCRSGVQRACVRTYARFARRNHKESRAECRESRRRVNRSALSRAHRCAHPRVNIERVPKYVFQSALKIVASAGDLATLRAASRVAAAAAAAAATACGFLKRDECGVCRARTDHSANGREGESAFKNISKT